MEFDAVFTVEKEIDKDTFIRQLLIDLAKNKNTPVDVVQAEIGEVRESIKEILVCSASVSGTCTASIGYDRREAYTDYETYKEKVGDTYVTRQRAVTKYRTVTDWRPFSTDFSGKATCAEENTDEGRSYRGDAAHTLKTISDSSFVVKGEAFVNRQALSRAIMHCEAHVKVYDVTLPGDKQKDERYQCSSNIEAVTCYKLPYYEVTFTYEGKEYDASAFACGSLSVYYDVPENKAVVDGDPAAEVEAETRKNTAALEKSKQAAWIIFWGTLAVGAFACFVLKFCWIWPVAVMALIYACVTNKKYNAEYQCCADKIALDFAKTKSQAQAVHLQAKIDALNQALTSRGYATLGAAETPVIDAQSDSVISKNLPKVAPPKSYKNKTIFCALLSAVLIISSLVVNNKNLHSPKQVDIEIVNKMVAYDPDASPYINGCYYIHFDFKVEAKKTGVEYVDVIVYVNDKDGSNLGYVTASLSGLSIDARDSEIVTVSLKENQPEKNEFFTMLYNTDLDDLRFEYEIESIRFDDGKYYFGRD